MKKYKLITILSILGIIAVAIAFQLWAVQLGEIMKYV